MLTVSRQIYQEHENTYIRPSFNNCLWEQCEDCKCYPNTKTAYVGSVKIAYVNSIMTAHVNSLNAKTVYVISVVI